MPRPAATSQSLFRPVAAACIPIVPVPLVLTFTAAGMPGKNIQIAGCDHHPGVYFFFYVALLGRRKLVSMSTRSAPRRPLRRRFPGACLCRSSGRVRTSRCCTNSPAISAPADAQARGTRPAILQHNTGDTAPLCSVRRDHCAPVRRCAAAQVTVERDDNGTPELRGMPARTVTTSLDPGRRLKNGGNAAQE